MVMNEEVSSEVIGKLDAALGIPLVDIALGLIMVYLLLSLLCTALVEWWSKARNQRATMLRKAIVQLLGKDAAKKFYDSPLIKSLNMQKIEKKSWLMGLAVGLFKIPVKKSDGLSYISPRSFAMAAADVTGVSHASDAKKEGESRVLDAGSVIPAAASEENKKPAAKKKLLYYDESVLKTIENWFNDGMKRLSGSYTRWARKVAMTISFVVVLLLNADTIKITKILATNDIVRKEIVKMIPAINEKELGPDSTLSPEEKVTKIYNEVSSLSIPIGLESWQQDFEQIAGEIGKADGFWGKFGIGALEVLLKLIGLLITAVMASFHSQFWFDLLKKFVNIRASGKNPNEEKKE